MDMDENENVHVHVDRIDVHVACPCRLSPRLLSVATWGSSRAVDVLPPIDTDYRSRSYPYSVSRPSPPCRALRLYVCTLICPFPPLSGLSIVVYPIVCRRSPAEEDGEPIRIQPSEPQSTQLHKCGDKCTCERGRVFVHSSVRVEVRLSICCLSRPSTLQANPLLQISISQAPAHTCLVTQTDRYPTHT
jgi:hypothetical protein